MTRFIGRRLASCHHEAGHALARWYFGYAANRAVVITREDARAGRWPLAGDGTQQECNGLVEGRRIEPRHNYSMPNNIPPELLRVVLRDVQLEAEITLVYYHAGVVAEAVYTKYNIGYCWMMSGGSDRIDIKNFLGRWYIDDAKRDAAAKLAIQRATALVRSKPGSAAIKAMASALLDQGEVKGDDLVSLCKAAYGGRNPTFSDWSLHWPPRLADLRAGFIPLPATQAA